VHASRSSSKELGGADVADAHTTRFAGRKNKSLRARRNSGYRFYGLKPGTDLRYAPSPRSNGSAFPTSAAS
jgi:hypothetical protein